MNAVLRELRALGERRNVEGMARFGIRPKVAYGVAKPKLDALASKVGRDHRLALELWQSGVHDARILAGMIDDASRVTPAQMECWARDFDSWDAVDGTCCHLFAFAAPSWEKAVAWSRRRKEYVKRAGFALMAYLAYKDRRAPDARYMQLLRIIRREAADNRHFVKKAVNWALRNIGKRDLRLNHAAIRAAEQIRKNDSAAARWIAADALRELKSPAVQRRLRAAAKRKASLSGVSTVRRKLRPS